MSKQNAAGLKEGANSFKQRIEAYKARVLGEGKKEVPAKKEMSLKRKSEDNENSQKFHLKKSKTKIDSSQLRQGKPKRPRDPSAMYLKHPLNAPVCKEATTFMAHTAKWRKKFAFHVGPTKGWRTSAKLSVRGNPPVVGLFAPGSHNVVKMTESFAHHPAINLVLTAVDKALTAQSSYDRSDGRLGGYDGVKPGGLSYLCANVETFTRAVQLIFVVNDSDPRDYKQNVMEIVQTVKKQLSRKHGDNVIHSVWLHCNPTSRYENNIYSYDENAWHLLDGKEMLSEVLTDPDGTLNVKPKLYFPPYVFRQANTDGFAKIVAAVRRWTLEGAKTVELYGGVGTIGLHLLDLVPTLVCSDENPHNNACFKKSLKSLPSHLSRKASYRSANATEMATSGALNDAEFLIVDPPRKGMEQIVIEKAAASPTLKRIVYVSCGFKAFQRDCMMLQEKGFTLVHGEGHVLFPGANHLETFAVFERLEEVQVRN